MSIIGNKEFLNVAEGDKYYRPGLSECNERNPGFWHITISDAESVAQSIVDGCSLSASVDHLAKLPEVALVLLASPWAIILVAFSDKNKNFCFKILFPILSII